MKKTLTRHLSLLLLICMVFGIIGTSCVITPPTGDPSITEKIEGIDNPDTSGEVDDGL